MIWVWRIGYFVWFMGGFFLIVLALANAIFARDTRKAVNAAVLAPVWWLALLVPRVAPRCAM